MLTTKNIYLKKIKKKKKAQNNIKFFLKISKSNFIYNFYVVWNKFIADVLGQYKKDGRVHEFGTLLIIIVII